MTDDKGTQCTIGRNITEMRTIQEHTVKSITLHIGGQSFFMNRGSLNLALFHINHGPRVTNVTDFKREVLQH